MKERKKSWFAFIFNGSGNGNGGSYAKALKGIILNLYAVWWLFFSGLKIFRTIMSLLASSRFGQNTSKFSCWCSSWTANFIAITLSPPFFFFRFSCIFLPFICSPFANFVTQTKWWIWILIYFTNDPKWQPPHTLAVRLHLIHANK